MRSRYGADGTLRATIDDSVDLALGGRYIYDSVQRERVTALVRLLTACC